MLQKYKSHKIVEAGKIKQINTFKGIIDLILNIKGKDVIVRVNQGYINKHNPKVGGYYVRYKDGYESFSPANVFEEGNTLIDEQNISSDNYIKHAQRTDIPDYGPVMKRLQNLEIIRLLHATMGLTTEAAELVDMLKKHIFYGKPLDLVNGKEEIGDTMWYVALALDVMQTTMDECMTLNIEKLKKRYPEKFTEEAAQNRDIKNEMSHFKK